MDAAIIARFGPAAADQYRPLCAYTSHLVVAETPSSKSTSSSKACFWPETNWRYPSGSIHALTPFSMRQLQTLTAQARLGTLNSNPRTASTWLLVRRITSSRQFRLLGQMMTVDP